MILDFKLLKSKFRGTLSNAYDGQSMGGYLILSVTYAASFYC